MNPEELQAWYPVLRDYLLLVVGIGMGVFGIVTSESSIATVGWGLAGVGAVGRVKESGAK